MNLTIHPRQRFNLWHPREHVGPKPELQKQLSDALWSVAVIVGVLLVATLFMMAVIEATRGLLTQ
jgi:hypothetical protein